MRRAWPVILFSLLLCTAAPAQEIRASYQALADSITRRMGFAPTGGNHVQFFHSGEAFRNALVEEIGTAKESIDLEYYWFSDDDMGRPVRDALMEKAREGLRVRVVIDNRIVPLEKESFYREMKKAGVDFHYRKPFNKVRLWNLPGMILGERDHRKIVVLDGKVCYTGGMNVCQETLEWVDTHMRIEGPAAVSLTGLFNITWQDVGGEAVALPDPVPSAQGNVTAQLVYGDGDKDLEEIYVQVLESAQRYIYFRTPYMVPPQRFLDALDAAARRGVDVRILLPFKCDWPFMTHITEYYYESLYQAGVRLYTYAPVYDHTKTFVTDDYLCSCGTVNLDNRSFYINGENTFFFYDESMAATILADFRQMLSQSEEVILTEDHMKGLKKTWVDFLLSIAPIL